MKILLVKCHKKTIYSRFEPVVTEPLELEILSAKLEQLKIEHRIYDNLLEGGNFREVIREYEPNLLLLSGYITAVDVIVDCAQYGKKYNDKLKVVVGGVHAEMNYEDFFTAAIDVVVHSNGINILENLLSTNFHEKELKNLPGIAYQIQGKWQINQKIPTDLRTTPLANRSYFERHQGRTRYMNYSPVSMVKTALSCPYACNFCYCKQLNMGNYVHRDMEQILEEISQVSSEYIWIIDDTFLIDRKRILSFIHGIKKKKIDKKFIAYSRVDFIARHEDIIEKLADIGFVELIVGMEAIEDRFLEDFKKASTLAENERAIELLRKHEIRLTALFIVGIDFTGKDFQQLRTWIKKRKLESYTVSIFTPLKGTEAYDLYEEKLMTKDWGKFDLLHLTLKPAHMHPILFYFNFYWIYVEQLFRSRTIRSFIFKSLKGKYIGSLKNLWMWWRA
ncbi:MAG: radical SAM protein [Thermotaleaceae bacterium]